jgi:hypothetical protein
VLGGFYDFKPIRILFRRANAVRSSRDGYLRLDGERCTSADHSFRYVISGLSKSARPFRLRLVTNVRKRAFLKRAMPDLAPML